MSECSICMGNQQDTLLSCNHGFCKDCINTWTSTKATCPICRSIIYPVKYLNTRNQIYQTSYCQLYQFWTEFKRLDRFQNFIAEMIILYKYFFPVSFALLQSFSFVKQNIFQVTQEHFDSYVEDQKKTETEFIAGFEALDCLSKEELEELWEFLWNNLKQKKNKQVLQNIKNYQKKVIQDLQMWVKSKPFLDFFQKIKKDLNIFRIETFENFSWNFVQLENIMQYYFEKKTSEFIHESCLQYQPSCNCFMNLNLVEINIDTFDVYFFAMTSPEKDDVKFPKWLSLLDQSLQQNILHLENNSATESDCNDDSSDSEEDNWTSCEEDDSTDSEEYDWASLDEDDSTNSEEEEDLVSHDDQSIWSQEDESSVELDDNHWLTDDPIDYHWELYDNIQKKIKSKKEDLRYLESNAFQNDLAWLIKTMFLYPYYGGFTYNDDSFTLVNDFIFRFFHSQKDFLFGLFSYLNLKDSKLEEALIQVYELQEIHLSDYLENSAIPKNFWKKLLEYH